jgi:predicted nucleic acid-binding protein
VGADGTRLVGGWALEGWDIKKRRDFQNDALIALTARRHGATVVTANRRDFEVLSRHVRVSLLTV